ncbi:MAG: DedA family protein [Candidatus Symbiothrix sp.]|jgi:membrane protein YqaA with SNARE-associated domain|nr:DedA family protein [Candidatus Symbiothrix sp.]
MLDFLIHYGYYGLFLACFLAATILPFSSDIVFGTLIATGLEPIPCLIVATVGNWLGGMTNYYLGYLGKIEWIEKYLKVKKERIDKMRNWLRNKGAFMAFFSFLPFVGDIIPLALGFMRANVVIVNISMFIGKLARYALIIYLVQNGITWLSMQ